MQIETTHPSLQAKIKHTHTHTNTHTKLEKMWGMGALIHSWWVVNWCIHSRTVWRILKRLKMNGAHGPAMPLLGICSEDVTSYPTDISSDMFVALHNNYEMETT